MLKTSYKIGLILTASFCGYVRLVLLQLECQFCLSFSFFHQPYYFIHFFCFLIDLELSSTDIEI